MREKHEVTFISFLKNTHQCHKSYLNTLEFDFKNCAKVCIPIRGKNNKDKLIYKRSDTWYVGFQEFP